MLHIMRRIDAIFLKSLLIFSFDRWTWWQ